MEKQYSIQETAALTGITAHTLRYYEKVGLIPPVGRATNGSRSYAEEDLAWIRFLTRLRRTGMSIRLMRQFAALRQEGDVTVSSRRMLLEAHKEQLAAEIAAMQEHYDAICDKITIYRTMEHAQKHDQGGKST